MTGPSISGVPKNAFRPICCICGRANPCYTKNCGRYYCDPCYASCLAGIAEKKNAIKVSAEREYWRQLRLVWGLPVSPDTMTVA